MRALIQRVSRAQAFESDAQKTAIAAIGRGMLCLVAFESGDTQVVIEQLAQKIRSLRIFSDANGKMNLAGAEVSAQYLLTSQFTLYADCRYGNRPSFHGAAEKGRAQLDYAHFVKAMERGAPGQVSHTPFGSDLALELVNDGPVTIWLDSTEVL